MLLAHGRQQSALALTRLHAVVSASTVVVRSIPQQGQIDELASPSMVGEGEEEIPILRALERRIEGGIEQNSAPQKGSRVHVITITQRDRVELRVPGHLLFAPEQLHLAVDKAQGIVPLPIAERPEQLLHIERMELVVGVEAWT